MPTKQPPDYARRTEAKRANLNRKYALTSMVVTLLFIAVIMTGLKLIGDAMESNKQMKACQAHWNGGGLTLDEAKWECRG